MPAMGEGRVGRLAMDDQLTTFVERQPGFYQERTSMPLEEMFKREIDPKTHAPTVVRELFDYWQARRTGALPAMDCFDPRSVFTPERFRWVAWIKLGLFDPLNSTLCKHPANVFGDWSGKTLRQYPIPFHARSCALEYLTCKMVQRPFYHEIRQTCGTVSRSYTRLLLPVADGKRGVTRLYYAIRHIDMSIADEASAAGAA